MLARNAAVVRSNSIRSVIWNLCHSASNRSPRSIALNGITFPIKSDKRRDIECFFDEIKIERSLEEAIKSCSILTPPKFSGKLISVSQKQVNYRLKMQINGASRRIESNLRLSHWVSVRNMLFVISFKGG